MSKAFTDEEAAELPQVVPARAPLPPGVPNYVTARGLGLLRDELAALQRERERLERELADVELARALAALALRRTELEARIASAELVAPPERGDDEVRFGANVTVAGGNGERRRHQIVGVDEADPAQGRVAFISPLARALLGRAVGDTVLFRAPRGEEELEIVEVDYES